jgi:hypothetical protein
MKVNPLEILGAVLCTVGVVAVLVMAIAVGF